MLFLFPQITNVPPVLFCGHVVIFEYASKLKACHHFREIIESLMRLAFLIKPIFIEISARQPV